jgi:hypothetical protein
LLDILDAPEAQRKLACGKAAGFSVSRRHHALKGRRIGVSSIALSGQEEY